MADRKRTLLLELGTVPLLAAAFTGCGGDETAYCIHEPGDVVVENTYCGDEDSGGGPGYYWFYTSGNPGYHRGAVITRSKGSLISSTNKAAIVNRGGLGGGSRAGGIGRAGGSGGFGGGS